MFLASALQVLVDGLLALFSLQSAHSCNVMPTLTALRGPRKSRAPLWIFSQVSTWPWDTPCCLLLIFPGCSPLL